MKDAEAYKEDTDKDSTPIQVHVGWECCLYQAMTLRNKGILDITHTMNAETVKADTAISTILHTAGIPGSNVA